MTAPAPQVVFQQRAYAPMLDWAVRDGGRIALIEGERSITYSDLANASENAGALLRARGVRAGDRVLIVAENGICAVVFLVAAQRLDAWPAMANARMPAEEIERMRVAADARLVVFVTANSHAATAHAAYGASEFVDSECLGRIGLGFFQEQARAEPVHVAGDKQVGLLLFTSGTTGRAKPVMISHRAMINAGYSLAQTRQLCGDDIFYGGSPISHVLGASAILTSVFYAGAALRLIARVDMADLVRSIATGGITFLMAVPTVYAKMLETATSIGIDLSRHRLRCLMAGGSPLDPKLSARVSEFLGLPMGNGYAMTECAPIARTPLGATACDGSVGYPEAGCEIRLVVGDRDAPAGEPGEIWVRGPSLMMGYYRDAESTAAVMRPGGWFATGDLGRQLPNGEYSVVGRSKDVIIRSGFNVYPAEVENALLGNAAIAQCAVVGRKTSYGDEEPVAFVTLLSRHGIEPSGILDEVSSRLVAYKRPARIIILPELPLGPTGKIARSRLAEMAAALD